MKNYSKSGDIVINSFLKSWSNLLTKKALQAPPTTHELQIHGEKFVTEQIAFENMLENATCSSWAINILTWHFEDPFQLNNKIIWSF